MQLRCFAVPAQNGSEQEAELNRFLTSQRVLSIESSLVADGSSGFWAIRVHCELPAQAKLPSRKGRVDYKEVLGPKDFIVYSALRELGKQVADREAVPVYHVFSNEQLAALVRKKPVTRKGLLEIGGVGVACADKTVKSLSQRSENRRMATAGQSLLVGQKYAP